MPRILCDDCGRSINAGSQNAWHRTESESDTSSLSSRSAEQEADENVQPEADNSAPNSETPGSEEYSLCHSCGQIVNAVTGCQNAECRPPDSEPETSGSSSGSAEQEAHENSETHSSEEYRQLSADCRALETLAQIKEDQQKLAAKIQEFEEEQIRVQRAQQIVNEGLSVKVAALEILRARVNDLDLKLMEQSANHLEVVKKLESFVNENCRQFSNACSELEASICQVASRQERLIEANIKMEEEQVQLRRAEENLDHDLTSNLAALEKQHVELKYFITSKLDQQIAIDESAAAEFQSFALDKCRLLDIKCTEQEEYFIKTERGQKELAENNVRLLNDLAVIQCKLEKVEFEQMECKCTELRMRLTRNAEDWKKLNAQNDKLSNKQIHIQRELAELKNTMAEDRLMISGLKEKQEERNLSPLVTSVARALILELHLDEIIEKVLFSNRAASENPETISKQMTSEQLVKALVSEIRVENKKFAGK